MSVRPTMCLCCVCVCVGQLTAATNLSHRLVQRGSLATLTPAPLNSEWVNGDGGGAWRTWTYRNIIRRINFIQLYHAAAAASGTLLSLSALSLFYSVLFCYVIINVNTQHQWFVGYMRFQSCFAGRCSCSILSALDHRSGINSTK